MKRPAEEDAPDQEEAEGGGDSASSDDGEQQVPATGSSPPGQAPSKRKRHVQLSDGRIVSVKVRNHVNPLLPHFNKPVPVPFGGDWTKVFQDLSKPMVLDIGCAKGRFCLEGAKLFPQFNWLGIEIREALTVRANEWAKEENLSNLHYIFGNASGGMADFLASMPKGLLQRVTVQCPDPLFKKKHQKRRMVNDKVVQELSVGLAPGGYVFVQSDVEQVAMQMVDTIAANGNFDRVDRFADRAPGQESSKQIAPIARPHATMGKDFQDHNVAGGEWDHKGAGAVEGSYNWLADNPIGLMSERESSTLSRGLPMFRALFVRKEPEVAAKAAA
mmetsp:Transcript_16270/g.35238  ORF Transcript_16270/g.35238 Transcript_16270/m.35238 type:complete len:330 (-) Transcript_16270:138-1127(-)